MLLQGAGGVFALVGAVFIATKNFPASRAATLIGATQMFGMGVRGGGTICCRPADQQRHVLESFLDWNGLLKETGPAVQHSFAKS